MTFSVLGIDLALKWADIGSAKLTFMPGGDTFESVAAPAIQWPSLSLTPNALADAIDAYARHHGVRAVAIDGPQGWRAPDTPPGLPGVGRRCEYEANTPAKTAVYPDTYPANQVRWIEFSTDVFAALLRKRGVRLAEGNETLPEPGAGYLLLECFPTSLWRTANLNPLPGKATHIDLSPFTGALCAAFGIPRFRPRTHDDLQAVVAAVAAAAVVGGPAVPVPRGVPAIHCEVDEGPVLLEGLIWDARPVGSPTDRPDRSERLTQPDASPSPGVRVTQAVIDQVARAGRSQAQISLTGFPAGRKENLVSVVVEVGAEHYPISIGDTHSAWVSHQTGAESSGFDRLFAYLSDQPDRWVPVRLHASSRISATPARPDQAASHGTPIPDPFARTVSIPVEVKEGQLKRFGGESIPELGDCIGSLVVPAFAVKHPADLQWLTESRTISLFPEGTLLLCRVSGRQIPESLLSSCRFEAVPDATAPGAFVELYVMDELKMHLRGTKNAILAPSRCRIPALNNLTADSLNEAYRRISERFEPKRRSVGGNVYRSIYFFNPRLDAWRPIGEMRGDLLFLPR